MATRSTQAQKRHNKRLRCGKNSYYVIGNRHDPLNLEDDREPAPADSPARPYIDCTDPLGLGSSYPPQPQPLAQNKRRKTADDDVSVPLFITQRRYSIVRKQHYQHHNTPLPSVNPQPISFDPAPSSVLATQISTSTTTTTSVADEDDAVSERKQKSLQNMHRYRYGNFNRYYGNQPQLGVIDQRLSFLCPDMFEGKTVLDVGCNVGLLTISIAKEFNPSLIVGMDIDGHLIRAAQQNIRRFLDRDKRIPQKFPSSFPNCFGPVSKCADSETKSSEDSEMDQENLFPRNIKFLVDNYVLEKDADLEKVTPEYDVILLFATTKWIHLNNGDAGLKRVFQRCFRQLKPDGRLVLEATDYKTYRDAVRHCPLLRDVYNQIEFLPTQFATYLTDVVGFGHSQDLGINFPDLTGPLYILYKENVCLAAAASAANISDDDVGCGDTSTNTTSTTTTTATTSSPVSVPP